MDHPQLFPDLTFKENDDRVEFLDLLYRIDGRSRREHPMNGLYTGLAVKFKELAGRCLMEGIIADWDNVRAEYVACAMERELRDQEEADAED